MLLPLPQGCILIGKPCIQAARPCTKDSLVAAGSWLATARTREASRQKLCCGPTPEEPPKALQTSECDELLDPTITSCVILVKRQPGKFNVSVVCRALFARWQARRIVPQLWYTNIQTKPLSWTPMVAIESPVPHAVLEREHSFLSNRCFDSSSRWLKFVETVVCEIRKSL